MAHTPEQRDRMDLCGARKKSGDKCRAFAGQGTNHPGIGRCKFHLGNTKTHEASAIIHEARRGMVTFGQAVEIEPTEALLGVLHLSAGHLNWIREELAASEDKSTFDAQVLLRMWDDERDRIARISKAALDAGVDERQIRIVERYGEQLGSVLRAVFYDESLGLTEAQRLRLPDILRHHLSGLEGRRVLAA